MTMERSVELCGSPLAPPVEYIRWTLNRYRVPYRFTPAAAVLSMWRSLREGVSPELPLLIIEGRATGGVAAANKRIFEELPDTPLAHVRRPDPAFEQSMTEALVLPAARVYYAYMLPDPQLMKLPATAYVPPWHRAVIKGAYPLWRMTLHHFLKLGAYAQEEEAVLRGLREVFADTEARMNGRPFIAGETPGQEDLLFATFASPLLLPPGHPVTLPPLDRFPPKFQEHVRAFRATRAGAMALRAYGLRHAPAE